MIDEWGKGAKYWDHAWNPVIGCRKVSEGCANCYAARVAERFPELQDDNGGFEPHLPKCLKRPPKKGVVFVGNMTDILGEWNDIDEVNDYWLPMLSKDAVNLVLTKRATRLKWGLAIHHQCADHILCGITAENQGRFEERYSVCSDTAQWISFEPLLGDVNLIRTVSSSIRRWLLSGDSDKGLTHRFLKWVVIGAESGPNRRPCNIEWVRWLVYQCKDAGVPVFVKQLDLDGKLEKDIAKFPDDLQIRQVPWEKDK